MNQRSGDGHTEARRYKGGNDNEEREERDERLARQGDAAVDELRFEHPIPDFPQQRLLSPAADGLDPAPDLFNRVSAGPFGARLGHDPAPWFRQIARACSVRRYRGSPPGRRDRSLGTG